MFRTISPTSIRRRRILLRLDLNLPMVGRRVRDTFDLDRALPTIRRFCLADNVCVILSHHSNDRQSLAPLAPLIARRLGRPVAFLRNPAQASARAAVSAARPGTVFLAENLRFWPGEKAARAAFARSLARLGDVFVNDAFGELHRPYASIVGLPRFLPSLLGPLVVSELAMLSRFLRPSRPFIAIIGGAKVSTKAALLRRLSRSADRLLVGGALANTLLCARGINVGRSLVEHRLRGAGRIARAPKIVLPVDAIVAAPRTSRRARAVPVSAIGSEEAIYDIGPRTRALFRRSLGGARTIIWNGPLGLVERSPYRRGTAAMALALLRHRGARVLIGGGDTVAFLDRARLLKRFKYVSTGGGAMLAYLAGEKLPGLEALERSRGIKN